MAIVAGFQFSNPFPSTIPKHLHQQQQQSKFSLITTKAVDNPESNTPTNSNPKPESSSSSSSSDSFERRLENVKFRSGTGKKAEARKARKSKKSSSNSNGGNGNVFLPPVPLKEPVSDGLKVEFGFSRYTERINGRIAGLGLAALLLVELATGKSVVNYHSGSIVFIQIYFIATVTAVYIKYEKEKISIWPQ